MKGEVTLEENIRRKNLNLFINSIYNGDIIRTRGPGKHIFYSKSEAYREPYVNGVIIL